MEEWRRKLVQRGYEIKEQERRAREIQQLARELLLDGTMLHLATLLKFPDDTSDEFYNPEWRFGTPHNIVTHKGSIPVFAYYNGNKPAKGDIVHVRVTGYRRDDEGKTYGIGEVVNTL